MYLDIIKKDTVNNLNILQTKFLENNITQFIIQSSNNKNKLMIIMLTSNYLNYKLALENLVFLSFHCISRVK